MADESDTIRILHVEDDRGALEITKLFLERKGYTNFKITPVLSAEQGLEKLEEENFDVVVSDYKMPGMNGLEFLEELRKNGNDIPFIIFTGKGEEKVTMEALNKGANRYIKKEGNPNVLFDTLGRYIQEIVGERAKEEERERLAKEFEAKNKKQPLIQALEGKDWNVRKSAARALGEIKDLRAVEPLIRALEDEDEDVRKSAAWALGEIGSTGAVEPLIQTLKDEKKDVRKSAAWALGEIRDKRAIEALIQALRDKISDVRKSVAEALGKIGEPALEPLISALNDKDTNVQEGAIEAIGIIRDKMAVEPLSQALKVEDAREVAEKALEMIRKSNDESLARRSTLRHIARDRTISRRTVVPEKEGKVKRREEEVTLTPGQIKEISDLQARGYRDSNIAERTGISQTSITKYLAGARVRGIEATYLHLHRRKI